MQTRRIIVSKEEARQRGYWQLTNGYTGFQESMLEKAIEHLRGVRIVLVRLPKGLSIWRAGKKLEGKK